MVAYMNTVRILSFIRGKNQQGKYHFKGTPQKSHRQLSHLVLPSFSSASLASNTTFEFSVYIPSEILPPILHEFHPKSVAHLRALLRAKKKTSSLIQTDLSLSRRFFDHEILRCLHIAANLDSFRRIEDAGKPRMNGAHHRSLESPDPKIIVCNTDGEWEIAFDGSPTSYYAGADREHP
ncbi:hypothetical protein BD410DRAFT_843343 [Rickenella mellea]|uniref:Uncharacterized protein n=1 Tax=Rickenella mellea TaxID=50990 RepID=A0A4Y7PSF3_9AGAM|nr:hypothetical protein BD410DRAFT_843343 [Rickenella mellea]